MNEIWMPVVGLENYYEVSNLGKIRSVDRIVVFTYQSGKMAGVTVNRRCSGKQLEFYQSGVDKQRNCTVLSCGAGNHEREQVIVARVVWEAFNGKIPKDHWVAHKDGKIGSDALCDLEMLPIQEVLDNRNLRNGHGKKRVAKRDTHAPCPECKSPPSSDCYHFCTKEVV